MSSEIFKNPKLQNDTRHFSNLKAHWQLQYFENSIAHNATDALNILKTSKSKNDI